MTEVVEVMAAAAWQRARERAISDGDGDLHGPWWTPPAYQDGDDISEDDHARWRVLDEQRAALSALEARGWRVVPNDTLKPFSDFYATWSSYWPDNTMPSAMWPTKADYERLARAPKHGGDNGEG